MHICDISHARAPSHPRVTWFLDMLYEPFICGVTHYTTHSCVTCDMTHNTTYSCVTCDMTHNTTHSCVTCDMTHNTTHSCVTCDMTHHTTHSCVTCDMTHNPWQRCIGYLNLQVSLRKRAANCRALLRLVTYKTKASYASSPPCMTQSCVIDSWRTLFMRTWRIHTCMYDLLMCVWLSYLCMIHSCSSRIHVWLTHDRRDACVHGVFVWTRVEFTCVEWIIQKYDWFNTNMNHTQIWFIQHKSLTEKEPYNWWFFCKMRHFEMHHTQMAEFLYEWLIHVIHTWRDSFMSDLTNSYVIGLIHV